MNGKLTLAVAGDQAAGKTTLLIFLIEAMADAGMLSVDATRRLTMDPKRFLFAEFRESERRGGTPNESDVETITLDVDLNVLWDLRK